MSQPANTARKLGVCMTCERPAIKAKRKDGTGVRAVLWCEACEHVACGGDSFIPVYGAELDALPLIGEPRQRSLL